jgi:hypothetical protein
MVSLLALGLVLKFNRAVPPAGGSLPGARYIGAAVVVVCAAAIGWAVWTSKQEAGDLNGEP